LRLDRRAVRIGLLVTAGVLLYLSPRIGWWLRQARTLNLVVVDKTVPFRNYREHSSIAWILRALKIQTARDHYFDAAADYLGYDPVAKVGHDLAPADLAFADTLIVADTYGVYEGDYEQPGDVAALERSPKIYGGLSDDEASAIGAFEARGGLVIAEFNTFASPTPPSARGQLERLFGVRWTRWVARYWPDLQDPREVPRWVGAAYERVYHAPFDLKGGGVVFVHEDGDIVVLRDGEDLTADVITQERGAIGAEFGFPARGTFCYWVDILDPADAQVLYDHVVHTTISGAKKLADHGLPARFPAVTRRGDAYYMSGDFADSGVDLGNPERAWLLGYKELRVSVGLTGSRDEAFFWGFYAPIVGRLLEARARADRSFVR
jgi:hypothetical protein